MGHENQGVKHRCAVRIVSDSWLKRSLAHIAISSGKDIYDTLVERSGVDAADAFLDLSHHAIQGMAADVLEEALTEDEIRFMAHFFQSPLGRKWSGLVTQILAGSGPQVDVRAATLGEVMDGLYERALVKTPVH